MTSMSIILDGDNAWPDLAEKDTAGKVQHVQNIEAVAVLNAGMVSGRPSVAFRIELQDGTTVIAETSARLFVSAARAIVGRHPHLFD